MKTGIQLLKIWKVLPWGWTLIQRLKDYILSVTCKNNYLDFFFQLRFQDMPAKVVYSCLFELKPQLSSLFCSSFQIILKILLSLYSANSDQHQFSPDDIHRLSRDKVMRINKMIIWEKCFDLFSILPTNSLRKCTEISLENFYVDIGASRVNLPSTSAISDAFDIITTTFYWIEYSFHS